ncbi:C-reactive protein-like [Panulirus ornatus]|uniref:C-reactive protein-like n=1 Tax=Panulirus ornatus TaxID=150431 RepID=UPI003A872880
MWAPPRDDVWVRYNMSLKNGGKSSETSICYRVRPATLTSYEVHVSLAESDFMNNVIFTYREGNTNGVYYNGNRQYGFPNFTTVVALHQWVHYCHIFNDGQYRAFVDGEERVRGDLHTQVLPLSLNSTLILGQEQDLLAGGYDVLQIFRGHIAQVNIWDSVLSDVEVKDIASCRTNMNGNVFSSDREEMEVLGATVDSQRLDTLCQRTDEYVIFPEMRSLGESQLICHRVGYEVFGPRTSEANFKLYEESLQFTKSCSSNYHLWLGLTDKKERESGEPSWTTL